MTVARTIEIDIAAEADCWSEQPGAEAALRRAIEAAAGEAPDNTQVSVVLTDDATIQALNRRWRQQDKPTNVLSFPTTPMVGVNEPRHLGDIVIAYQTTAREAAEEGKPFAHHLSHLAVHGFLHLLGHDHDDDRQADAMENLERTILSRLGIPDPYALREPEALNSHA